MKVVLAAIGVLGLAALFGLFEPTSASRQAVTSDDVRLVSERMFEQASSQLASRQRNGHGVRSYIRGSRFLNQDGDSW